MAEPGVHIEIENYPVLDGLQSKAAGREVYVEKPHVRIRNAGEDKHEYFGPMNAQMQARFPDEWAAFQKGAVAATTGTPVERWPQMTQAQVKMLKNLHIYTVEDLATLSDAGLSKVGLGANKLRQDAQRFLSLAQAAADVEQMEELKADKAAMAEQIRSLQEQMTELLSMKPEKAEEKKPKK